MPICSLAGHFEIRAGEETHRGIARAIGEKLRRQPHPPRGADVLRTTARMRSSRVSTAMARCSANKVMRGSACTTLVFRASS